MKKRIILASVLVVGLASFGGVMALPKDNQPVKAHHYVVVTESTPTTQTTPVATTQAPAATSDPVATTPEPQPVDTAPTPEENAAKFKTLIQDTAKSRYDNDNFIWRQWYCLDQQVTGSVGYSNYDAVLSVPYVYAFLTPRPNEAGQMSVLQFGMGAPGICGHSTRVLASY